MMFSIIMATYAPNRARLKTAVHSVIEQHGQWELIIAENGSSVLLDIDDKPAWDFLKDQRIHILHIDEANVSKARNAAIKSAVGDYICFLDDDDMFDPRTLDIYSAAITDTKTKVLFNAVKTRDRYMAGRDWEKKLQSAYYIKCNNKSDIQDIIRGIFNQKHLTYGIYGITGEIIINRDYMIRNDLFFREDEVFEEDQTLVIAILSAADNIVVSNAPAYIYTQDKKRLKDDEDEAFLNRVVHHCEIIKNSVPALSGDINLYMIKTYVKYRYLTLPKRSIEREKAAQAKFATQLTGYDFKSIWKQRKLYAVIWMLDSLGLYKITRPLLQRR